MAAASGELELRASLIAHVLPSAASMFRKDGALKFLAGSTSTSGQQQVSRRRHGIATCGDAGEVVRAGSALPQRFPSPTVSSKTACTGKRPRNPASFGAKRASKGANSKLGLAAHIRRDEPPQQIDCANRNQPMMDSPSQQRGQRPVAGV